MRKAAKVYEAGEAVEGTKPKVVYESHKKCTPGEFGSQVKTALAKIAEIEYAGNDPQILKEHADQQKAMAAWEKKWNTKGHDYRKPVKTKKADFTPTQAIPHYTNTQLMLAPLLGAGVGGIGGALLGKKEKRLRNALLGATGGGLVGGGAALGYKAMHTPSASMQAHQKDLAKLVEPTALDAEAAATTIGYGHDRLKELYGLNKKLENAESWLPSFMRGAPRPPIPAEANLAEIRGEQDQLQQMAQQLREEPGVRTQNLAHHRGVLGGSLGAVLAAPLGFAVAGAGDSDDARKRKKEKQDAGEDMETKKLSAFEFGSKVAFSVDWNALKNPALGGAAAGAMVGGVHGLLSPGEDEDGKKRNRFGAMLRGVLGGGAVGGIGGAAAGHFAPGLTNDFMNRLRYQYTMNTPVPTQAQARTRQNFNAAAEEPFEEDGMVNPAMQAAQG